MTSWEDVIGPHGYRISYARDDVKYVTRPGKRHGTSATIGYGGSDNMYMFSDAAPPFAPHQSYSKLAAYTLLEHGGDWSAAAARAR